MDVSIIIPAHNAAPFIEECLASIARAERSGMHMEVIVIDDASTDDTADRVRACAQRFPMALHLLRQPVNRGGGAARRRGFEQARGRYFALMDADDLALPMRFAEQAAMLDARPGVVMCGGDLIEFDHGTQRPGRALAFPVRHEDICADLLFYCAMWAGTTMFRRELLAQVPYPTARVGEDWLFAFEASMAGELASTGRPCILYRIHPQQTTADTGSDDSAALPIWRHMLQRIGLEPDAQELRLHALCSPYLRKDPFAIAAMKDDTTTSAWSAWSQRLHRAGVGYTEALADRCSRIQQTLYACRYAQSGLVRMF